MGLPLNVDYRKRGLVQSATNSATFTLPPFVQNDGTPIDVTLLDSDGGTYPTYTRRAVSTYTLKVGLFLASNGSQLAFQTVFTDDVQNNVKRANLTQNAANVTTALGSSTEVSCYLEIEISSDGGANYETVLPYLACTLRKEYIATASTSVPANETAVTVSSLGALVYQLLRYGFPIENSTTGSKRLIYLDDNDQVQAGPIPE